MPATTTTNSEHTPSVKPATADEKPVFFWKPNDGNRYLSQWYRSKFSIEGETYVTEMWMMVHKARYFGDEKIAAQMLAITNPKEHKALGRKSKVSMKMCGIRINYRL